MVSFCVPTYSRAGFIRQTIESALKQTMDDIEIVIVDDDSPDNTAEVVRGFSDQRIHYFRNERNLGVPENLNRAVSLAKGSYLVLLEDHDVLSPTYLEETLKIMERYPSVGFVATGLITIDNQGNPQEQYVESFPEFMPGRRLLRRLLIRTDCPFPVTTLIRRSAIIGLEPLFDSRYGWYADQYLWLRLSAKADFGYASKPLLKFRLREKEHYLANRHWESLLCLNRIHRDNWHLLHSNSVFKSGWNLLLYEKSKLWNTVVLRLGRIIRNERWTEEDQKFSGFYLSSFSRLLLKIAGILPLGLAVKLRDFYKIYHQKRTGIR